MIVLGILALVFSELAWASRVDVEEDRVEVLDAEEDSFHADFVPATRSHARIAKAANEYEPPPSSSSENIPGEQKETPLVSEELPELPQTAPTTANKTELEEENVPFLQAEIERLRLEKEALKLRQEVAELEASMPKPTTTSLKPKTTRKPSQVAATRRIRVEGGNCPSGIFLTPLELYGAYLGDRSLREIDEETFKEMNKDAKTTWDCFLLLSVFGISQGRGRPLGIPFLPVTIKIENERLMWDNLLFILEQGAQPNKIFNGQVTLFDDQTAQELAGQVEKDKLEAMFATLANATGVTSSQLEEAFGEKGDLRKLVLSRD
jgi:hypothetical protein